MLAGFGARLSSGRAVVAMGAALAVKCSRSMEPLLAAVLEGEPRRQVQPPIVGWTELVMP